ncbi:aspartate--tRNA ligase [Candidatus Kuenenbacteria bacterium]|nr:aspartate--tRNA ligase [Candidatus Kuenenbacteria bacterium]
MNKYMTRTISKDVVTKINETVRLNGWVNSRRNMGKIVFLDMRDRWGIVQVVCVPNELDDVSKEVLNEVRPEFVLEIEGVVQARGEKQINPNSPTGTVEVLAKKIVVLSKAETPPFEIDNEERQANEELRLKYRYLDLRHERMKQNIVLRHEIARATREFFYKEDFLEIETPYISKSTPEGARDFLVPSRHYPGKFFALPQSPQQYKQLLMVAGAEKYFQMARCFRDEDSRGDRQPEFTQMDLEMSFVERDEVMELNERALIEVVKKVAPEKKIQEIPFPRMSYKEAMEKYGTDRPDLRKDKEDPNLLAFCWVVDFPFFEKTEDGGWTFTHNPFSLPKPEYIEDLMNKKNIESILTTQYDVVLNGYEIGGGSIRAHRPEILKTTFEIMGYGEKEIQAQFGHVLEAFKFGTPPHGGIAWGFDRLVMLLAGEPNIREIIAFPKTADNRDPMMDGPSEVKREQLEELGIEIKN